MEKKTLYVLLVAMVAFILGIVAGVKSVNCPVCPEIKTETKVIYPDTNKVIKKSKPKPTRIIKHPTYMASQKDTSCPETSIALYEDSLVNENLSIFIKDTIMGTLQGRELSYKLKVPLRIETTKTVTEIKDKYHNGFYIGVSGGVDLFSVNGSYVLKDWTFAAGYNFYNKSPIVGINRRIF
jgi:hypothetical protein